MSFKKNMSDMFNSPSSWVREFLLNNYMKGNDNLLVHKLNMYRKYQKYAKQHNKGDLTLEEFHNEVMRQWRDVRCETHYEAEYYTGMIYEPVSPDDAEFYRIGVQPDGSMNV